MRGQSSVLVKGPLENAPSLPTKIVPTKIPCDSNFPANSLWVWGFHPLTLRLCLSQIL